MQHLPCMPSVKNTVMVNRRAIGISVVFLFWIIGFYPFHFHPPSQFHMTADGKRIQYATIQVVENIYAGLSADGLHFPAPGIAFLPEPPFWLSEAIEASSINVELTVRPAHPLQYGPARIFTISKDIRERNLTVGQEGSDLIIRVRTPDTDLNGIPPYRVKDVFRSPGTSTINMRIGRETMSVRVNGREVLSAALPQEAFSGWSPNYRIAFGNELTFDRPWIGDIYKATVSLHDKTISYALPGALSVPDPYRFEYTKNIDLNPFPAVSFSRLNSYKDWAINFFGFSALGLLIVYLRRRPSSVLAATLLCAALSLSIESGQLFFVERSPSSADLLLNTLGGSFGAWIGRMRHVVLRGLR